MESVREFPALGVKDGGIARGYAFANVRADSIVDAADKRSLFNDAVAVEFRHAPYDNVTIPARIAITDMTTINSTIVKAERNFVLLINYSGSII